MKREAYLALSPADREKYDNDYLIGFLVRCRLPLTVAIEAITERMRFLKPASRDFVIEWLRVNLS